MASGISICTAKLKDLLRKDPGAFPALVASPGAVEDMCEGAERGGDIEALKGVDGWLSWLRDFYVELDENDYMRAAVYALYLAPHLAATDYGTARQRDLAQVWTDTLRGFLGEVAFAKWLRVKFGVAVELDYSRGRLEEFLPSDIKRVGGRPPNLRVSIKTTKLSGIWLDVPYKQVEHSDVFVMVRVGVTREHFLAFMKKISVIRDKILSRAKDMNVLTEKEVEELWKDIPEFKNIPAVVVGFIMKTEDLKPCYSQGRLDLDCVVDAVGRVKDKRKGGKAVHVSRYIGFWDERSDNIRRRLVEVLKAKKVGADAGMPVEFEGIGEFTRVLHFIASSGYVVKTIDRWQNLICML